MTHNSVYKNLDLLYSPAGSLPFSDNFMINKIVGKKLREEIFSELAEGQCSKLEKFVRSGGSPDIRNDYGHTPLIAATLNYDPSTVRKIIELGANPHATDNTNMEAMFHATVAGDQEIIKLLLDASRNYDQQNSGKSRIR
jgi:ankyrin repeat protein